MTDTFCAHASTHEEFSFMLMERIVNLENEVCCLQQKLKKAAETRFFIFEAHIIVPPDTSIHDPEMHDCKNKLLDSIFEARQRIQPVFCAWRWYLDDNYLIIHVAMCTKQNFLIENFKNQFAKNVIISDVKCMNELYMFVSAIKHMFPRMCISTFFWHHIDQEHMSIMKLTNAPFTTSTEYMRMMSLVNQEILKLLVFDLDTWYWLIHNDQAIFN